MSKVTVNNLAELQTEIGKQIEQSRRQSYIDRFHIPEAPEADPRDARVKAEYDRYVRKCGHLEYVLAQWEWELLGYADGVE